MRIRVNARFSGVAEIRITAHTMRGTVSTVIAEPAVSITVNSLWAVADKVGQELQIGTELAFRAIRELTVGGY